MFLIVLLLLTNQRWLVDYFQLKIDPWVYPMKRNYVYLLMFFLIVRPRFNLKQECLAMVVIDLGMCVSLKCSTSQQFFFS